MEEAEPLLTEEVEEGYLSPHLEDFRQTLHHHPSLDFYLDTILVFLHKALVEVDLY